ncbi:MAG: recombinase family protein [Candidatus Aegiribacteria sp.]|nr:recombinase family protein [Candidatus Aegiribacteria sp.]
MFTSVCYLRVSTSEQVKGFSLITQEKICRSYCASKGWSVSKVYVDEGESARSTDRPQFLRMMEYIQKHKDSIDYLVVYRFDRFARYTADHFAMKSLLQRYSVQLISATEKVDDSPAGELVEGVTACVNQYESRVIGIRAKVNMLEARKQGRLTGPAPTGYLNVKDPRKSGGGGRSCVVVDEEQAPYIKKTYEMYATGLYSLKQIAEHISELGYRSRLKGIPLSPQQVHKILTNITYAGWVKVDEETGYVQSAFPALIDQNTFNIVQRILHGYSPTAVPRIRSNPDFPLRHIIKCGGCGKPLTASWSKGKLGKKYPYYRCYRKGCKATSIRKEDLENEFIDLLESLIPSPDFLRYFKDIVMDVWETKQKELSRKIAELQSYLSDLRHRRSRVINAFLHEQSITQDVYEEELAAVTDSVSTTQNEISGLQDHNLDIDRLFNASAWVLRNASNTWVSADLEGKQRLQQALFPDGLEYSMEEGYSNPRIAKAFNVIQTSKASPSKLAGGQGFEPR